MQQLRFSGKWAPVLLMAAASIAGCRHSQPVATPGTPQVEDDGPPGRVARLSYLSGAVSFKAAGTQEWVAAELNRPLTAGDSLWTDAGARAELQLGSAVVRLDAYTSLSFFALDDQTVQVRLAEGDLNVRLMTLGEQEVFEVDTPQAAVTLLRSGEYRIRSAQEGDRGQVTVRNGMAEVSAPGDSFVVHRQEQAELLGTSQVTHALQAAGPLDAFDDFCAKRDARRSTGADRYVAEGVIGRDDLDSYGTWRVDAAYGPMWAPRVAPGWAPYRFGHWAWIEPWGWTWIDDAAWGFAPHHYGRWIYVETVWWWIPGPVRVRVVYAPALVVFVGGGGLRYYIRVGVGVGVGWFPLGPREIYIPPYRAGRRYITNVNITNTVVRDPAIIYRTDIAKQRYMNHGVMGAITAVPEDAFARGRPVSRAMIPISRDEARTARVSGMSAPVVATRDSVSRQPEGAAAARRPPERVQDRRVVVRQTPAARPVPFESRRPALEADPGRPPDARRLEDLRGRQPQPQPEYKQVPQRQRSEQRQPTAPQRQTAPPRQTAPQRPAAEPPRVQRSEPTVRQQETRRKTIERERQESGQRGSGRRKE
ncbi:MAG: hypothetical protein IT165_00155 [Bryobacterales bacterium]|nr:hypothetical protein [Bryobacterales bacterium]